jgi:DNA-binding MarR family transcriptional regulator
MARTSSDDAVIPELADRLGHAAVRLARLLRQQDEGALTPTMRAALGTISREGPVTLGELAAIEQVAPPTITKVVAKLEDAGLVERDIDVSDRRVCRVTLTVDGQRWMDQDRTRRREWLTKRVEELDASEVVQLTAAVEIIETLTGPGFGVSPESR